MTPLPSPDAGLRALRADCTRCFGLCCVAPAFVKSADFALDKPASQPCPHLQAHFGCAIHERLQDEGFRGCGVYDCFGAGQRVAQHTFGGRTWRRAPRRAERMFRVFEVVRRLHELLWYLNQALAMPSTRPLRAQLRRARRATELLARSPARVLLALDVDAHRAPIADLLRSASALARAGAPSRTRTYRGADLAGAILRRRGLCGADFRGACLIGADLAGSDLRLADLCGADLRGANLAGADLSTALFVTQAQLQSARGDLRTQLPDTFNRPAHWGPANDRLIAICSKGEARRGSGRFGS